MEETAPGNEVSQTTEHYHPALVTLHWVIVVLVLINLFIGLFVFAPALSGGGGAAFRIPEPLIALHIAVGLSILILLIVRFVVRLRSKRPAPAEAGNSAFNALARFVHYALYIVLFALTVVGLIFALQTNRLQRAFFGGGPRFAGQAGNFGGFPTPGPGTPFPTFDNRGNNFQGFGNQPGDKSGFQGNGFRGGPRAGFGSTLFLLPIHLDLAILLSVLLVIHLAAAIYHQFILRDHLLRRMWFHSSSASS